MDFSLNDHQKLIRDTVRQFMEAEVRPGMQHLLAPTLSGQAPTAQVREARLATVNR